MDKILIRVEEVSEEIFGISSRRYRMLAEEKKVPEIVRGKINFFEASKALIEYYRKLAEGSGSLSLTDERTELTRIQKELKNLELMIKKGELVRREESESWLVSLTIEVKSAFLSLPRRMAQIFIGKEPREVERLLKEEIHNILRKLSRGKKNEKRDK